MKIWAHRGASAYAPENTLPAFRLAAEQGADGIELDVHLSADGELMVSHDERIDRCSSGTGEIRSMTCGELKRYNYSNGMEAFAGVTIPTLREVFELIQPTGLTVNVELKTNVYSYPGIEEKCLALAEELGMTRRVLYSSFSEESLARLHRLAPGVPAGLLYEGIAGDMEERAKDAFWTALHPDFADLYWHRGRLERFHAMGKRVHTWTVNEPEDIRRLIAMGVDAIITNCPDVVREIYLSFRLSVNSWGRAK